MSLVDCGSVDVSAVAPISVDLSKFSGIGNNPCEVKLQNESPLTLQVNIGGDQHRLGAWTVDKFPLCGKTNFQVVPSQIQSPAPAVVPSNLLFVTVAPDGETIPGTFPAPLARMTTGTLILGSGTATVGSINAVLSTVTVAGTINIGNTPAVTISGTPTVNIGTVTGTVTIAGAVSISSGTVTIANASIGVINAAGTKITSSRPPQELLYTTMINGTKGVNFNVPADIQALVVILPFPLANYSLVGIEYNTLALVYTPLKLYSFAQNVYVIPLVPGIRDSTNDNLVTVGTLNITSNGNVKAGVEIWALFESAPEWLTLFPQPQLEPNQPPLLGAFGSGLTGAPAAIAKGASAWIIAPVPNIQITLFDLGIDFAAYSAAATFYAVIGHGTVLPGAVPTAASALVNWGSSSGINPATPFSFPFHGAQLPRGDGLWINNFSNALGDLIISIGLNYSLS